METIKRFKKIAYLLSTLGFISALSFCVLTLEQGMRLEGSDGAIFSGGVLYLYQDMVSRYLFILICFLLFIAFLPTSNKVFLKLIGLIPLAGIILQSLISVTSKKEILQNIAGDYSNWLEITCYMDFGFLALTSVLLILQLRLIQLIYRTSVYDNT